MINLYAMGVYNREVFVENNEFYTLISCRAEDWQSVVNAAVKDEPIAILFSYACTSPYVIRILNPLRNIGVDVILIEGDGLTGAAKLYLQDVSKEEGWEYYTTKEFLTKYCTA